jgi:Na+(H+)/acetate symporter ActP
VDNFDPSKYLPAAKLPILWVNGTNDFHYRMDNYRSSFSLPKGRRDLSIVINLKHSHPAGWAPPEIQIYVDQQLRGGVPLPAGVLGVMVAGLLSAYVSTISTHLNWGTSYLVHDLYRRFLRPGADERHYVLAGRLVTALLMVAAALLTLVLDSARTTFNLLLSIGAGTGLLYLLRWFWWRINAWSEVAAMVSSFVLAFALFALDRSGVMMAPHVALVATVALTTAVWLAVTWTTAPTDRATLQAFYRLVRPAGPGWSAIRRECDGLAPSDDLRAAFVGWAASCVFVYSALFGTGHLIMGHAPAATVAALMLVGSGILLWRSVARLWSQ